MRLSALLAVAALGVAAYSLWSVKRVEREVSALSFRGEMGAVAGELVSQARKHCEKALRLLKEGRRKEAEREMREAIEKLSRAEERGRATRVEERIGDLVRKAEEALKALRERLEREGRR